VNEVSKHLHKLVNPKDWEPRTRGEVRAFLVPGDHNTMASPPHVHELAKAIKEYLMNKNILQVGS
jgi:thioesterase domain-containing protein